MLRNYLTVAWRNLLRHKLYSSINILGLAVGMAACVLIGLFVRDELSYDRYHQQADQIYRILGPRTCFPLGAVVREAVPEVLDVVRFTAKWKRLVSYGEKRFEESDFIYADPNVFAVFSFPLAEGDPQKALQEPLSLVITRKAAKKYFGDEDPLGKVLRVENQHDYTVTGVLGEVPRNSHFHFDFLATFAGAEKVFWKEFLDHWGMGNFYTYLVLHKGSAIPEVEEKIAAAIVKPMQERNPELGPYRPRLQPLLDIHLHSADLKNDLEPQGDIAYVYVFSTIALFVLLIACINFMNLSTARAARRTREVGVRKAVGAHRLQLIRQFLGEAVFLSILALVFALALIEVSLPHFNALVGKELVLFSGNSWAPLAGLVGVALCVGLIAGAYPAFFLSAFQPVEVLKGRSRRGGGGALFRKVSVGVQFSISIALIVGVGIIYSQMQYLKDKALGFDQEHLLVVRIPDREKREALKNELLHHASVVSVSSANIVPPEWLGHATIYRPEGADQDTWVQTVLVDYGYFETLGIELVAGRTFSKDLATDSTDALIFNESAARLFGLEHPLGAQFEVGWKQGDARVIGVVKNFHFESLYEKIAPVVFLLDLRSCWQLILRIRPDDVPGTLAFVEERWRSFFPEEIFSYWFVDQSFDEKYRAEERTGKVAGVSALLAVFVACLGLFGLASFTAEQRTKEIGIRKVLGASVPSIVALLSKEFTYLVLVANVIAWPLAWYTMNRWLQNFAYRIELGPGVFVLGGVLALLIAWLTVSYQAIRAARANPVEALRYE